MSRKAHGVARAADSKDVTINARDAFAGSRDITNITRLSLTPKSATRVGPLPIILMRNEKACSLKRRLSKSYSGCDGAVPHHQGGAYECSSALPVKLSFSETRLVLLQLRLIADY
jgi:hypothetical protein